MNVTVHMAETQADQTRKLPRSGLVHLRPLKNVNFCLSSRKAIILTTGIH
jgi:hypothetical protein